MKKEKKHFIKFVEMVGEKMKKASLVIKEIQEGTYNDVLKEVYIDESRIEKQPQRYVAAIEKFISLYGDQEIEIYSTPGRSEVSGNHTDHQKVKF